MASSASALLLLLVVWCASLAHVNSQEIAFVILNLIVRSYLTNVIH